MTCIKSHAKSKHIHFNGCHLNQCDSSRSDKKKKVPALLFCDLWCNLSAIDSNVNHFMQNHIPPSRRLPPLRPGLSRPTGRPERPACTSAGWPGPKQSWNRLRSGLRCSNPEASTASLPVYSAANGANLKKKIEGIQKRRFWCFEYFEVQRRGLGSFRTQIPR